MKVPDYIFIYVLEQNFILTKIFSSSLGLSLIWFYFKKTKLYADFKNTSKF